MVRMMLFLLLVFSLPARADLAGAREAYRTGDYEGALKSYLDAGPSAEARFGACQTLLVIGGFFREGDAAARALHGALDHCAAAIKSDPQMIDAHISYAIGLGLEGKRLRKPSLAKQCRSLLEEHLVVWDDYPELNAALGGWHTQVAEAGFLARLFLGGRRSKARHYLEKAVALAPNNIAVRLEYIKFLALGKKRERHQALEAFTVFASLSPQDAAEALLKERAQGLRQALEANDKKAIETAVGAVSAFTGIEHWRALPAYQD
ncbi:MAG: hypothetical protein HWE25_15490 [Alphaproteobacteria bacterium]|nr:hypothetical protein [Alphaproteobacteria bacterium]